MQPKADPREERAKDRVESLDDTLATLQDRFLPGRALGVVVVDASADIALLKGRFAPISSYQPAGLP